MEGEVEQCCDFESEVSFCQDQLNSDSGHHINMQIKGDIYPSKPTLGWVVELKLARLKDWSSGSRCGRTFEVSILITR